MDTVWRIWIQYGEYGYSMENMDTVLLWRCEGLLLVIFPYIRQTCKPLT